MKSHVLRLLLLAVAAGLLAGCGSTPSTPVPSYGPAVNERPKRPTETELNRPDSSSRPPGYGSMGRGSI